MKHLSTESFLLFTKLYDTPGLSDVRLNRDFNEYNDNIIDTCFRRTLIATFLVCGMMFGLGHGSSFHYVLCDGDGSYRSMDDICYPSVDHHRTLLSVYNTLPAGFGVGILEKAVKTNGSWVGKLQRAGFHEAHNRFVKETARDKLMRLEAAFRGNKVSYEKSKRQQIQLKAVEERVKALKETYGQIRAKRPMDKPDETREAGRKENDTGYKSCNDSSDSIPW